MLHSGEHGGWLSVYELGEYVPPKMRQSAKSTCLRSKIILQLILLMALHSANTEAECSKQAPQLSQRAALPALCRIQLLITVVSVDLCESQCEIYSVQRRSALITVSRFDRYENLPKISIVLGGKYIKQNETSSLARGCLILTT